MMAMVVLVVDGQGGGVGRALVEELKGMLAGLDCRIIAVGTNTAATTAMRKAGADSVATGENAVIYNAARADIIAGSIGIIAANAMMGELSPAMAAAISSSDAIKILIPSNKCGLVVAGVIDEPIQERIVKAARMVQEAVSGAACGKED
jgi:hypothetical protein